MFVFGLEKGRVWLERGLPMRPHLFRSERISRQRGGNLGSSSGRLVRAERIVMKRNALCLLGDLSSVVRGQPVGVRGGLHGGAGAPGRVLLRRERGEVQTEVRFVWEGRVDIDRGLSSGRWVRGVFLF